MNKIELSYNTITITEHQFEVGGELLAVSQINSHFRAEVEELRKNGQEDTHMGGVVEYRKGRWEWCEDEGGGSMFDRYGYEGMSQDILEHLNQHEHPDLRDMIPPVDTNIPGMQ